MAQLRVVVLEGLDHGPRAEDEQGLDGVELAGDVGRPLDVMRRRAWEDVRGEGVEQGKGMGRAACGAW